MEVFLATLASMFRPDQRFIVQRYTSTRIAMIVGLIAIAGRFSCELVANQRPRWELALIAGVMAVTKILAMAHLRLTH